MPLIVHRLPAFSDNYLWLFHQPGSRLAFVVDPGAAEPVLQALTSLDLDLSGILITHHHPDHVGGIDSLLHHTAVPVYGPPDIRQTTHSLVDGDQLTLDGTHFKILGVPGHTLDHIAFFEAETPLVFCGDTLFAGGCGRLFEGSPEQMWRSLSRLAALPPATKIYCAHEYTKANLLFAKAVEPENPAVQERLKQVIQLRNRAQATVPSSLAEELATNPFLRVTQGSVRQAASARGLPSGGTAEDVFAIIRHWKDQF
ncbi:hydroxyacylglutathione hydrolase [Porticoccus sp.]|uniref:hydroxyacylglutathione hydrolase n=1 Tax=Porticoccus sp. TaxID=2024853 RepID=UPI000C1009A3|nr:MAG: hydroxyacylglutathione hydrolase [Porticoccus sp.]